MLIYLPQIVPIFLFRWQLLWKDSNSNNAVYIIRDKKAHLVPIKTGEFGKNSVIVTSGLAKGDIVITAGTQQLQEGTAVSQWNNLT